LRLDVSIVGEEVPEEEEEKFIASRNQANQGFMRQPFTATG